MSGPAAAARAAKLAAKYGPHVVAAVKVAGPTAREAVEVQRKRLENRHFAFDKARTLTRGSVLRQRDGKDVVWVVFTGDEAIAVYPEVSTPIPDLVRRADLAKRVTPEEHDAAKVRKRAARVARHTASRAGFSRRREGDAAAETDVSADVREVEP